MKILKIVLLVIAFVVILFLLFGCSNSREKADRMFDKNLIVGHNFYPDTFKMVYDDSIPYLNVWKSFEDEGYMEYGVNASGSDYYIGYRVRMDKNFKILSIYRAH